MLKDGHEQHTVQDMDDFDPVNYIEDYPKASDIRNVSTGNESDIGFKAIHAVDAVF